MISAGKKIPPVTAGSQKKLTCYSPKPERYKTGADGIPHAPISYFVLIKKKEKGNAMYEAPKGRLDFAFPPHFRSDSPQRLIIAMRQNESCGFVFYNNEPSLLYKNRFFLDWSNDIVGYYIFGRVDEGGNEQPAWEQSALLSGARLLMAIDTSDVNSFYKTAVSPKLRGTMVRLSEPSKVWHNKASAAKGNADVLELPANIVSQIRTAKPQKPKLK